MENLDNIVEKLLVYVESAEAFAAKEVPLYVQELLEFQFYNHLLNSLWALVPFMIGVAGLLAIFEKNKKTGKREYTDTGGIGECFIITSFVISVLVFGGNVKNALKTKIAPRVYVVDYLNHKLNK